MKKQMYLEDFISEFERSSYSNCYSELGLEVIYSTLIDSELTGEEVIFDILDIRRRFQEYSDIAQYNEYFGTNYQSAYDITDKMVTIIDDRFIIETKEVEN